jgi:CRP/FNR family transcriptional regulator
MVNKTTDSLTTPMCVCQVDTCALCEERLHSSLTSEQMCQIHEKLIRVSYSEHEMLFHEGEPASYLFALRAGQVKLMTSLPDGRQQILRVAVAGQLLGLEIFKGGHYPFTAEALTDIVACKIHHRDLQQILAENAGVSWRVIQSLSQELDRADILIRDLGLKTAQEKVSGFLLSLIPKRVNGDDALPLLLSRREIAEMLGLTEETVSRVMAEFHRNKIIETCKGFVRIPNPKELEKLTGVGSNLPSGRNRSSSE